MTEKDIQNRLFEMLFDLKDKHSGLQRFYYITPNVNLFGWESDLIVKDVNDRIYEFEIKTSKEDFIRDTKKDRFKILSDSFSIQRKPNFFYYIIPADSGIEASDVPDFAGFYYYRAYHCIERGLVIDFYLQRESEKLTDSISDFYEVQKLLTSIYFKYWRSRTGINTRIKKKVV